MRALVLSSGGLFGAWQAGAWKALAAQFRPDLVVGASVGALNGYCIACRMSPDELVDRWRREELASFRDLHANIRAMVEEAKPEIPLAVVATDLLRLRPKVFHGAGLGWRQLAASCAVPWFLPQVRIGGTLYSDGGLLNPLPVWAAAELGATEILALNVLPEIPASLIRPFVRTFRHLAGHHPPLPSGVSLEVLKPDGPLGTMRDGLHWKRENIERWLAQGHDRAKNISILNCLGS